MPVSGARAAIFWRIALLCPADNVPLAPSSCNDGIADDGAGSDASDSILGSDAQPATVNAHSVTQAKKNRVKESESERDRNENNAD